MLDENIIIEIRDVSKAYPGVLALNKVSVDIKYGTVHCILGENGAGKSTLIKILSGAEKKDSGKIFLTILNSNQRQFMKL